MMNLVQAMPREDYDDDGEDDHPLMRNMEVITRSLPPLTETDERGEWGFTDLTPGTYEITAFASPPRKDRAAKSNDGEKKRNNSSRDLDPKRVVFRKIELTIADEDRKTVTIELEEANTILGNVVVEGSEMPVVGITINQRGGNELLMGFPHPSEADGTFMIDSAPTGEVILDAVVPVVRDFYLKSITLGSQDLLREPLVMTEGAEVTGVRITVGQGLATVTGRVQLKDDGSPAARGGVLLIKSDPKLWHLFSSRVFAMTNAAGEFKLRCAPGEYLVFAWPAGGQPLRSIEDFVRSQAATARTISLQSKEEKQIELTVNTPRK